MKRIVIVLVLFGLIGGGIGIYLYNKPVENLKTAQPDISIEAKALFDAFETDEATANTKYLDKVIQVTGNVQSVQQEGDIQQITLDVGNEMAGVICELDNRNKTNTTYEVGATLTVKGMCTGMLMDVVLVRCVPVEQ